MTRRGSSPTASPGGALQIAVTTSGNLAYSVYRQTLAPAVANVVPSATRDALFQLFCDLRANVPKDEKFLRRHARALTPQTPVGWLAAIGVGGYLTSAVLLLSTLTLGISVAGLSMLVMSLMAIGTFLATSLTIMAFCFVSSSIVAAGVGAAGLMTYFFVATSLGLARRASNIVFGSETSSISSRSSLAKSVRFVEETHSIAEAGAAAVDETCEKMETSAAAGTAGSAGSSANANASAGPQTLVPTTPGNDNPETSSSPVQQQGSSPEGLRFPLKPIKTSPAGKKSNSASAPSLTINGAMHAAVKELPMNIDSPGSSSGGSSGGRTQSPHVASGTSPVAAADVPLEGASLSAVPHAATCVNNK